jgi:uncharacterized membrane protein
MLLSIAVILGVVVYHAVTAKSYVILAAPFIALGIIFLMIGLWRNR